MLILFVSNKQVFQIQINIKSRYIQTSINGHIIIPITLNLKYK